MSEVNRDLVGEFIDKANAAAASRPNPLVSEAERQAIEAAGPAPTPTGDHVRDFQNRQRWLDRRRPNPMRQP